MSFLPAVPALFATVFSFLIGTVMFVLSRFLILLILIQRGKGGGLAGALGGPGGQSAFGSKAGDTITMVTAGLAIVWGLVCAIAMYSLGIPPSGSDDAFKPAEPPAAVSDPDQDTTGTTGSLGGLLGGDNEPSGDSEMTPAEGTSETEKPGDDTETGETEKPADDGGEASTDPKPADEKPADDKPADASETPAADPQPGSTTTEEAPADTTPESTEEGSTPAP